MDGVLIIDKPVGLTSHDVVSRVRRILRVKRVGHTGTLDPFATGVLVVLIGRATRLAQFLDKAEKEYQAVVRFGFATDTGDLTGTATSEFQISNYKFQIESRQQIENALAGLRGVGLQTPPMYSAKKIAGKKLYELARKGETVERKAVQIEIKELEAETFENGELLQTNDDGTVDLRIRVVCSAGTYIRVLAEDIGARLGVAAHLASLRRTRAGSFDLLRAVTLEALEELTENGEMNRVLISPGAALAHLPMIALAPSDAKRTLAGMKLIGRNTQNFTDQQSVGLCDEQNNLLAVAKYDPNTNSLHPRVVLALPNDE